MDLVTYVTRMPQIGETVIGKDFKQMPGGKGANQADAIARLGTPVRMLGGVGEDALGKALLTSLHKDGVDVSQIENFTDCSTGIAAITVDDAGNNCIIVTPGANYRFLAERVENSKTAIAESEFIVTQLEIPMETVSYALQLAKKLGKTTILNPAPACELDDVLLSNVDILIPNETELELLSGKPLHSETAIPFAMAVAALTVTKKGAQSSLPYRREVEELLNSS
jgi:ribokinase